MTSDDQYFLDVLGSISNDIRKFSSEWADTADRQIDALSSLIREALIRSTWLPESAKPRPLRPPPALSKGPVGYLERIQGWVSRNRALTAALIAFFGTGAFMLYTRRTYTKKRRAKRASNGARQEVVVIGGPPNSPITKSLVLDLERRGFIVYVVVSTPEEEQMVQDESRIDIRPLHLDVADPPGARHTIERFSSLLTNPHQAFAGIPPHDLHFAGLILAPDLIYPTGPVETITPELWSDALNAKVLGTVATAQAFLPVVCDTKARVLVLTPSIVSSLRPPFHSVETMVVGALEGFIASLRGELSTLGVEMCHFKLGTFEYGSAGGRHLQHSPTRGPAWSAPTRKAKGSSLRELHNAVFDALTTTRPRKVRRVGRGSITYDIIGNWVPSGLVGWMLGMRPVAWAATSMEPHMEDSLQWEEVERTT